MNTKFVYVCLLLTGLWYGVASCGPKKQAADPEENIPVTEEVTQELKDSVVAAPQEEKVDLAADESLNDAARFVAGLPIENKSSKLYALTQTKEWKSHSRNMEQIWNSFQQTAPKAIAFAQAELSDINDRCHTLFYPFGGPDFLFSNTFFPNMDTYMLIGLERAGSAVQVKHPSAETYRLYQDAVSDILNLSFFRTKDMKVELSNDTIDGVVPIITLLMVRADRELVSIRNARFTEEGEIVTTGEDGASINRPTGLVEIKYFREGTNRLQTLYYYSTDLSNGGLPRNKKLQAYIQRLDKKTTATFIKSASYLMHENYFSNIREAILGCSSAVMQDDSGIPISHYQPTEWDITLYGTFYKPISLFSEYPQPELRDAYQLGDPKPLNFRIGYARQSNVQIARKKVGE